MAEKNTMLLKSSDNEIFEVERPVVHIILKNIFEDLDIAQPVPLPSVSGRILTKVIQYCDFHVNAASSTMDEADVKAWDNEFVELDHATMFAIILAANYLNIQELLDLTCIKMAEIISGKTPDEIRTMFNLKDDFVPEEEEEIRRAE